MQKEKITLEAYIHLVVHFVATLLLFWAIISLPFWISVIIVIAEILQIKLLGECILTFIAHKRGIMTGMTYWQYLPYLMGIKNYSLANTIISRSLELSIVVILLIRSFNFFTK